MGTTAFVTIMTLLAIYCLWTWVVLPFIGDFNQPKYDIGENVITEEINIGTNHRKNWSSKTEQVLAMIIQNDYNPDGYQLINMLGRPLNIFKISEKTYGHIMKNKSHGWYLYDDGHLEIDTYYRTGSRLGFKSIYEQIEDCLKIREDDPNFQRIDTCYVR